jgi:predicted nucleotidyltransferase
MSELTKLDIIKLWAKDLCKCKSIEDFFFWVVGSFAVGKEDASDFDIIVSGPEDHKKIKNMFEDAIRIAEEYELPLDICYWSVPPVGLPIDSKIRKYKNELHWAKSDLEFKDIEKLDCGISMSTIRKRSWMNTSKMEIYKESGIKNLKLADMYVMKASLFLQSIMYEEK